MKINGNENNGIPLVSYTEFDLICEVEGLEWNDLNSTSIFNTMFYVSLNDNIQIGRI